MQNTATYTQIEEWVQRWGCEISEAILDNNCSLYSLPGIEGGIGYTQVRNYAVVFGDPICSIENVPDLTRGFHEFCQKKKISIIYVGATENFAKWAASHLCKVVKWALKLVRKWFTILKWI